MWNLQKVNESIVCVCVCGCGLYVQVASNLSERSSLLAGLHWTLARPITNAEQQLDKQLEVWYAALACSQGVVMFHANTLKLYDLRRHFQNAKRGN